MKTKNTPTHLATTISPLKKGKVGARSDHCNQAEIAGFSLLLLQLWKHFWSLISFPEWQLLFCRSTHNKVFTGTWSCLLSVYFWNINICMYFSSRAVYLIWGMRYGLNLLHVNSVQFFKTSPYSTRGAIHKEHIIHLNWTPLFFICAFFKRSFQEICYLKCGDECSAY